MSFEIKTAKQTMERTTDCDGNCYTCGFSPVYRGPGTMAGCMALTMDEDLDQPVIDYCVDSGANSNDGWPVNLGVRCQAWVSR